MDTILLAKPPEQSRFSFGAFSLAVLAAAIEDLAEVRILDATDMSIESAASAVWEAAPGVLGVTTMSVQSVGAAAAFIRTVRTHPSARADTMVVAGGHGADGMPGTLLRAGADLVVRGEGERTFRNVLLAHGDSATPGIARLDGNRVVCSQPAHLIDRLDDLPPPARNLMPVPRDGVHLMETSRGCPFACSFCETTLFHGRRWRAFSPGRVSQEVRRLVSDQGAWVIEICDDNFAASHRRVREICAALREGPLPALFLVSARADDLAADPELIPVMAASHMQRVSVGVETLDPRQWAIVDKPIDPALYRAVFSRMRDHGMFSVASFIVGLPGERRGWERRALELAVAVGPDAARFVPFLPMPGLSIGKDRTPGQPDLRDERRANELNAAFLATGGVRERLSRTIASGGIPAIIARGVLERGPNDRLA